MSSDMLGWEQHMRRLADGSEQFADAVSAQLAVEEIELLRARAERAEAQLEEAYGALRTANRYTTRVRPVVDAAITFVEEWDDGFHDNAELLEYLSAAVKEAQRDG